MPESNWPNTDICQHRRSLLHLPYKCKNSEQDKMSLNLLMATPVHADTGKHLSSRRDGFSYCRGTFGDWHRGRRMTLQTAN